MSTAVKSVREVRDDAFRMLCNMTFEERAAFIRKKAEEAKRKLRHYQDEPVKEAKSR
jgi:hypothetical protein